MYPVARCFHKLAQRCRSKQPNCLPSYQHGNAGPLISRELLVTWSWRNYVAKDGGSWRGGSGLLAQCCLHTSATKLMFIQVEDTPNPNSLKFYPGETVLESGTVNFQDKVQGSLKSPLAKALFRIKGVKSVFFAQDFVTVSKEDDEKVEWNVLKPQIFSAIMIFYSMKQPILYSSLDEDPNKINESDSNLVKEIKALITERIRPTIQEDGGDLEFVSFEDNIVRVRLQGACTSCPSSVVTLKNGIKNMLQYYVPEVQDVEQVHEEE